MTKKTKSHAKNEKIAVHNHIDFSGIEKYILYFLFTAFAFMIFLLIKTAWLCDDAFITFRTIDNFVNGYGLRFNIAERVQAYTHPLWLFIITVPYFVLRDPFYTPIILSMLLTLITVYIFSSKIAASKFNALIFILILISSKSFVDYSTSGLENPLSHLISALFIFVYFKMKEKKNQILILSLIASLGLLTRMDSILLYLPAIVYLTIKSGYKKNILPIIIGFTPFILWSLFSVIYYGYPFPNTYYAKLNTGVPKAELLSQGLYYFINSIKFDPATLLFIFAGIIFVFIKREKRRYPLIIGAILYLLYIIYIGGDFMSGRFFSLPLITIMMVALSDLAIKKDIIKYSLLAFILLLMFFSPGSSVMSDINYSDKGANFVEEKGISDERGFYYKNASLWRALSGEKMPNHPNMNSARNVNSINEKIFLAGAIGFFGYYAGPSVYVIDVYALADPLLARYHVVKYDPIFGAAYEKMYKRKSPQTWRIGHFLRPLPPGYTLSILKDEALIDDPKFNEFYKTIRLITRSNIFSAERFSAIWKMNTGQFDSLIEHDKYKDYNEIVFHDDLLRFKPDYARYYYARGNFYYRRRNFAKAIPDFEQSVILDRYHGSSWYKLSIAQYSVGRFDKALHALQNAKNLREEIDPEFEKELIKKLSRQNNTIRK